MTVPGASWTRRSGSQHRRLCARPGCGTVAAATLRFQPTQREAWLMDLDRSTSRAEGDLCARHAAALVLPRGWQLHDERTILPSPVTPISRTELARRVPPQLGVTEARDDEELAEVLDARTPLLRRAFSNTRPRAR